MNINDRLPALPAPCAAPTAQAQPLVGFSQVMAQQMGGLASPGWPDPQTAFNGYCGNVMPLTNVMFQQYLQQSASWSQMPMPPLVDLSRPAGPVTMLPQISSQPVVSYEQAVLQKMLGQQMAYPQLMMQQAMGPGQGFEL